ncbi:hypothetical protein [Nostoc sp. UHCC 0870]|nr:hypothetical protein [Nostoc sp. UHCC 0870]
MCIFCKDLAFRKIAIASLGRPYQQRETLYQKIERIDVLTALKAR